MRSQFRLDSPNSQKPDHDGTTGYVALLEAYGRNRLQPSEKDAAMHRDRVALAWHCADASFIAQKEATLVENQPLR